jgi:hypothetical protein
VCTVHATKTWRPGGGSYAARSAPTAAAVVSPGLVAQRIFIATRIIVTPRCRVGSIWIPDRCYPFVWILMVDRLGGLGRSGGGGATRDVAVSDGDRETTG